MNSRRASWSQRNGLRRVIRHLRGARDGETDEQAKARGGREIAALLDSPFFDLWARAGIAEILSALHERVTVTA